MVSFRTGVTKTATVTAIFGLLAPVLSALPQSALASSHREAPYISTDSQADNTDVYAFVSPDRPDTVTLIANFVPFEEPAGGPNFYKFGEDVLYEVKVDNNGDAEPDISYQFRFQTQVLNPNTFLYNTGTIDSLTDPDFNIRQTYTLTKVEGGRSTVLGSNIPVPPNNVGPKSTPNYEALSNSAIWQTGDIKVFAGQMDDPFFVELGGLFDLLTIRQLPGNAGGGIDGLKGYNTQSIALQVPITQLTRNKAVPANAQDPNAVIGVWSTASRESVRVLNVSPAYKAPKQNQGNGGWSGFGANFPFGNNNPFGGNGNGPLAGFFKMFSMSGPWVQVSRLGMPLVNEVVIPLLNKDVWNGSQPRDDAQFANYVTDPELGRLLKGLYNIQVPPQGPFGSADQRDDLIAIFLTGIPNLNQPANVKPSEQIRLNVAIQPTANPNPLGVVAGDNQGYPNGRRLADDVTDISIKAVAGAAYPLFHPTFTPDPLAAQLGDGVNANDKPFRTAFPYLALPGSGFASVPHP
jgi:hypothetical protein